MNTYQKMTLESFLEKLKDKQYEHATAARRGIGKAQHLSAKDKASAQKAIDELFGVTAAAPAGTKSFAKKAAKKVAVKAAPKAAKKVAAKAGPKKAAKKVVMSTGPVKGELLATLSHLQTDEGRVMRQHAAATVLGSLIGRAPLSSREELLYNQATREYLGNGSNFSNEALNEAQDEATSAIRPSERIGHPRIPVHAPKAAPTNGNGDPPPFDPKNCTPEELRQHEILASSKAIHERS